MRVLSLLCSVLAGLSVSARALTPASPPNFEPLFVGTFEIADIFTIPNGTFGTRTHVVVPGGSFNDPAGNLVATMLPTSDTGIIDSSGVFFPESILPLIWTADKKLAHLRLQGIGRIGVSSLAYIHLETDSEQYRDLNSRFLVANITFPEGGNPVVTIFGST
ncbi:hypothetical protein C8Q76DRAFT_795204 [Earliella scabrosa]|nr:hypothetical protein C8Q76DRAFT_795204 [Earliella scabrosa]